MYLDWSHRNLLNLIALFTVIVYSYFIVIVWCYIVNHRVGHIPT